MPDITYGIRLTGDASGIRTVFRTVEDSAKSVGVAVEQIGKGDAFSVSQKGADFLARLKQMAEEAGKTQGEILRIRAAYASVATDAEPFIQRIETANAATSSLASRLGEVAKIAFGGAMAREAYEAINAIAEAQVQLDKMSVGLKAATGANAAGVAREIDYVREKSDQYGQSLVAMSDGYVRVESAARGTTLQGEKAREVFEAIAVAGSVFHMTSSQTADSLLALEQMISKGTVQAQELKLQLGNNLPGAMEIAARAMGVTTGRLMKMMEQGQVVADDFLPRFAAQIKKELGGSATEAANSMQGATNRLGNAWVGLKQQIAESGVGEAWKGQLKILQDGIDGVTERMRQAKSEGSGFWGQAWAMARGSASFLNPLNGFSYSPETIEGKKEKLEKLRSQNTAPDNIYANYAMYQLQQEIKELEAKQTGQKGQTYDWRGQLDATISASSRSLDALRQPSQEYLDLLQKLQGNSTEYQKGLVTLKREYEAGRLPLEKYNEQVALLTSRESELGKAQERLASGRASNYLRQLDVTQQFEVDSMHRRLDSGDISFDDYAAQRRSLQKAMDNERVSTISRRLKAPGATESEKAGVQLEIEQIRAEASQLDQELKREAEIVAQRREEVLRAINAEASGQTGNAVEKAQADFEKRYHRLSGQASARGDTEMTDALQNLQKRLLNRAQFDDAKRGFDELKAQLEAGLEQIKTEADSGDLGKAMGADEASAELRGKLIPALQEAAERMRSLAGDAPDLSKTAAEASKVVQKSNRDAAAQASKGDWQRGATDAMADYLTKAKDVAGQVRSAFSSAFQSAEDAVVAFATGSKVSFGDMARSFLADLVRIQVKMMAVWAYEQLLKSSGSSSWVGAAVGAVGAAFGGADTGSSFSNDASGDFSIGGGSGAGAGPNGEWVSSLGGRASGGSVDAGSIHEVTEYGPELLTVGGRRYLMTGSHAGSVTPVTNASSTGSATGSSAPQMIVNIQPPSGYKAKTSQSQAGDQSLLEVIFEQVDEYLATNIASGRGSLTNAIQTTYGANRAAGAYR